VYTFGCNDEFALGRENEEEIDKVTLPEKCIEITAGDSHCAGLSESGVVYAWGTFRDGSGVLGLEQKKIAKKPMRFNMPEKIAKISSGADHLIFLTVTGKVFTAGNSEHGQLGRVSKYNSCRGGRRGCDMILVPSLVRMGKKKELMGHKLIENVWATAYCTFMQVKDSDIIVGYGLNNCYQLGIEDAENRYQPDILPTLKFDAKLAKVAGGMHHTLFLDVAGNVYSMGSHRYGGLGLGSVDADVKRPVKIEGLADVIDIAANTNVSFAVDKHGKVFSWGTNYSKQLGQDTEDDYFVPTLLKSKQLDVRDGYLVSVGGQHSLLVAGEEKDEDESDTD
jgi:regulator of chromosome condensation